MPTSYARHFIEARAASCSPDTPADIPTRARSVSLIAAEHMQNLHGAAIVIETESHAPLPNSKPVLRRRDVLKAQHVADRVRCVAVNAELDSSSRLRIELPEISFRGRGPDDFPRHNPYFRMTSS